ncbi:FecR domain-containing protein [Parapedobacter sp. DT-150]|uniref:FecR domain-containing protein n=1 Tax=Parapedobacter sp. DT-150 TaxID=3396162 RepID=UPI003F1B6571
MKPNQYHIAEWIGKYLLGQLSEGEEIRLKQWLNEDERNQALLESFRDTDRAKRDIDFIREIDVDAAWTRLQKRNRAKQLKRIGRYLGYAASIALIACSWIWFSPSRSAKPNMTQAGNIFHNDVMPGGNKAQLILSDGQSVDLRDDTAGLQERDGTQIVSAKGGLTYETPDAEADNLIYNTLVIPKAGTYQLTLSDGTKVWLNAMSELRFPVQFGSDERVVELKGEAYFEVAHDAARPFKVAVDSTQIEVLGTHFNVNSYKQLTATLVEGAIRISNKTGRELLKPGQEARVGEHISLHEANIAKTVAWKNGDFYFKSDDMTDIMEQLSRWYDISVSFENEPPAERFNGNIQRSFKLSEALDILSYLSGATFEVNGQQVSIRFPTN